MNANDSEPKFPTPGLRIEIREREWRIKRVDTSIGVESYNVDKRLGIRHFSSDWSARLAS